MSYQGNLGLLFTKLYFNQKNISYSDEEEKILFPDGHFSKMYRKLKDAASNKLIAGNKFLSEYFSGQANFMSFSLTTIYPGLLIGSGYIHDIKSSDAIKLGFYFDHATGLPIIPGSSIKGVLRSAFEKADGEYVKSILSEIINDNTGEEKLTKEKIVKLLTEKIPQGKKELTRLFQNIFEGKHRVLKKDKNDEEKYVWDSLPMHKRDFFFDAFPVKVNEGLLSNDFITPHKEAIKSPKPIQFLKVLPGVIFRFDFKLNDLIDENGTKLLTAEEKKELFRLILLDLGIGAKTNVGYGQFVSAGNGNEKNGEIVEDVIEKKSLNPNIEKLEDGQTLKGKIINLKGGVQFDLEINSVTFPTKLIGVSPKNFEVGQIINVKVIKKGKYFNFELVE